MKSSPDTSKAGIIRGASVSGVVFCSPSGELETKETREKQDKEHIKALEQYWYQKGYQDGLSKGVDDGLERGKKEGEKKGHQEGLERGKKEGFEEGKVVGLKENAEAFQEELDESTTLFSEYAEELKSYQDGFLSNAHSELIPFCLSVCEQILRREINEKESYSQLLEMLFQQASNICKGKNIELIISPDDLEFLENGLEHLKLPPDLLKKVYVSTNPNLSQGDCRVETELGLINFDIKRQLEGLEKRLLELCDGEADTAEQTEEMSEINSGEKNDGAEAGKGD